MSPNTDRMLDRHIHRLGEAEAEPPILVCEGLGCGAEYDWTCEGVEERFYQSWLDELKEDMDPEHQMPHRCPACEPGDFYDDSDLRTDLEIERRHGL